MLVIRTNSSLVVALIAILCLTVLNCAAQAQMPVDLHPLIQINCGGGADGSFVGDTYHDGGQSYGVTDSIDLSGVTDPAPPPIYSSERYGGDFTYVVPVAKAPPGKGFVVRLHFAEVYDTQIGQRVMNVSINGNTVLTNFDIIAQAGGVNRAIVKEFDNIQPAKDGTISIEFSAVQGVSDANAKVNGIEIFGDGFTPALGKLIVHHYKFDNPALPLSARVDDMISHMSLREKVSELENGAQAIPRLHLPAYDYWSEGLHGIANEGYATVFPQAIAMASTWDTKLVHTEGDVVSTEARAKFNVTGQSADHGIFNGLTIWSPNINIFRDPRWGRGQETYGEDPFLTARMGVNFIEGLQGSDPKYLRGVACAKHFAVHSGPESERHRFNATPPERDLYETYLPQFEAAVREAHVGQVMSAYTAINGVPCPADQWLLTDLLRTKWGFDGYVVSDCDAVNDVANGHHYAPTVEAAAADSVKAGTDLNCGGSYLQLLAAEKDGLITEAQINVALGRVLTERFKLGLFDPPTYAYAKIGADQLDNGAHSALALKAAREALVLLKNDGTLPLKLSELKSIAVIGSNADDSGMLVGNYNGTPSHPVTILAGIRAAVGASATVTYNTGCPLATRPNESFDTTSDAYQSAISAAKAADVVIYVGGITAHLEGEEMNVPFAGFNGGDRTKIELPDVQDQFLQALCALGKPVVFINCSGSAMAFPWEADHVNAIVQAWYPGENGGTAVADLLLGRFSPSGRLPITFYRATTDLPDFEDYSMANRTYRYFTGSPLYPFGYGLSYTKFSFGAPLLSSKKVSETGSIELTVPIKNVGAMDGDEVVQVYVKHPKSQLPMPIHSLVGFARISTRSGQTAMAAVTVHMNDLRYWDVDKKKYVVAPGQYELQVGESSADIRQRVQVTVSGS